MSNKLHLNSPSNRDLASLGIFGAGKTALTNMKERCVTTQINNRAALRKLGPR